MANLFQELDYQPTPLGPLTLRRRREPVTGTDVYEVKLGADHLMSSLFTASEIALGTLGTQAAVGDALSVVVGGLGLGYTAQAVLADSRVTNLVVIEMFAPVIAWHKEAMLPMGDTLVADKRCRLVEGDFFALAREGAGFDPDRPEHHVHAILLDIDHAPEALLDPSSASFYLPEGLRAMATHLHPKGVFGLWSNEPPDDAFTARLSKVFVHAWAEPVTFENPLQQRQVTQTVYLGQSPRDHA